MYVVWVPQRLSPHPIMHIKKGWERKLRSQPFLIEFFQMWTCGESNPGPNKEAICFLHAYSSLDFRTAARPGPPTAVLPSKKFRQRCEVTRDYSRFSLHRLISGFGKTSSERCLVPAPSAGIKPVTYCTSVRQRERSCFRQLNCCSLRLWS